MSLKHSSLLRRNVKNGTYFLQKNFKTVDIHFQPSLIFLKLGKLKMEPLNCSTLLSEGFYSYPQILDQGWPVQ